MDKTQDYQKKPLVFMFLWKQALRVERDFSLAESFYQSSKTFAKLIGDGFLVKKLTEEWQEDVKNIYKHSESVTKMSLSSYQNSSKVRL
ncbi:transcriptional activator domain protein [Streptococcus pneumoniae GA17971]|nr:transcriptional activator domain protein [Streptococcus pneumoniae GA17971]